MANVDASFGLRPVRHLGGGQLRTRKFSIASGYSTSIFKGDVVELTGADDNVARAAAGNGDNLGVFWGCRYVDATGSVVFGKYWPASTTATEIEAYVFVDPLIVYAVQGDGTDAAANVGELADFIYTNAGNTTTGISGAELDTSTVAATGGSLRILGLAPYEGNAWGDNAVMEVQIAEHALIQIGAEV